jgi:hypothetical protein
MKLNFWIWTLCCIVGAFLFIRIVTTGLSHSGSTITLLTDDRRQLVIEAEAVTIEAASGSFFALHHPESGVTIVGAPTERPLGWSSEGYYLAEPTSTYGGLWLVERGTDITVRMTGASTIRVTNTLKPKETVFVGILGALIAIMLWAVGLLVADS